MSAVAGAVAPPSPASLDTGEYLDIDAPATRAERNDRLKVLLEGLLDQAARAAWGEGREAEALQLDAWARKLDRCRYVRASREATCGSWVARPMSCDVRLCPDCERARSARLVGRYAELAERMQRPVFWTLTVPNVPPGELKRAVGVLLDALAHLRRRAILRGGRCGGAHTGRGYRDVEAGRDIPPAEEPVRCEHPRHRRELGSACRCADCLEVEVVAHGYRVLSRGCPRCRHQPVEGGVYSVEVTWSGRDWHPHAHLLLDAPWISWSEMRDAWRAVTCDAIRRAEQGGGRVPPCSHPTDERGVAVEPCRGASVVWVEAVSGEPGSHERIEAIGETLKYVSKGLVGTDGRPAPGAGPAEIAELLLALQRRRLVAGWGAWRHVRDDEEELDPSEWLVGPEVPPELRGLPRVCPVCGQEAAWEWPVEVPRAQTARRRGALTWLGPP